MFAFTAPSNCVLGAPKWGTQREGGGANKKTHWGITFCPKMMILQGVGHPMPYLALCYANDPKGHEQRILSSHITPRHRHMVRATILSSLF